MNAPFSWPKSSDSRSVSGIAAQFNGRNGRSARGLSPWTPRATSSFPVPLSPVIRTFIRVGATRRIFRSTSSIAREDPTIPSIPSGRPASSRSRSISRRIPRSLSALKTAARRRGISTGLRRKSEAPARTASIAPSTVP